MNQTVFITGCSTGIGRATARLFQQEGWNVVATMRNPEAETELAELDRVQVLQLDVTEIDSINHAVETAIEQFGKIDALVNNAGYGTYGVLESIDREKVFKQFNTNVFGLIDVTKAVLPHFRQQKSGTIVNVSSLGGRVAWPLGSVYHASKFAIEGLTEALSFELSAIGVRVKLVEPGRVATDFNGRSMEVCNDPALTDYQPVIQAFIAQSGAGDTYRSEVDLPARKIFDAVTDGSDKLRYPSGEDAEESLARLMSEDQEELHSELKSALGL